MAIVLISFTTRPGEGSEGGVGWEFLLAAIEASSIRGEKLIAIVDARDAETISEELSLKSLEGQVEMKPVSIPRFMQRAHGMRKTRETYLSWLPLARRELKNILKTEKVSNIHQVTFATATMPPIFLGIREAHKVWGPIGIPSSFSSRSSALGAFVTSLTRVVGRHFSRSADTLVATNRATHRKLESLPRRLHLEPNIVVPDVDCRKVAPLDHQFCMVGTLYDRKRPEIAIDVLRQERFSQYTLTIVGDGPMRGELESMVETQGLKDRITFVGKLSRSEAIKYMSSSRVLLNPSESEGASWVIGEAAAVGVPAVVFSGSGSESTVEFSDNGGAIALSDTEDMAAAFGDGIEETLSHALPQPTDRWSASRLPSLLERWWV